MASAIEVEPTMSTNSAPTWRSSPPRRGALPQRPRAHVLAHLAAEQVADALALAQPVGHPVEAGLEQADLAAVVHLHVHVELAVLDPLEAAAHRDTGWAMAFAAYIVASRPVALATTPRKRIAAARYSVSTSDS